MKIRNSNIGFRISDFLVGLHSFKAYIELSYRSKMLKPVFFPHTYISPAAAAAIRSAFTAVVGYRLVASRRTPDMQELAESGFLEIVAPAPEDEERLDRILQEFERWGRLQQGGGGLLSVFFSSQPGLDPLTADGSAAQIASEIRRPPSDAPPPAQEALMRAGVFLQLAHQADQQGYQVSAELQRCEAAHSELLHALTGEDAWRSPSPAFRPQGLTDPEGELLLKHRVRAWARLFLQRPYAGPVFVTVSPEVVGLLSEKYPSLRRIGRSELEHVSAACPASAQPAAGAFMVQMLMLASQPLPAVTAGDDDGSIDPAAYVVPDLSPLQVFAHLAESDHLPEAAGSESTWRHTVIVELSRRSPP
jgi:hypothetical protein